MKTILLVIVASLSTAALAQTTTESPPPAAATPSSATAKKGLNKQIYENDDDGQSITAKVKLIREIEGETEVFFEGDRNKGVYQLPSTAKNYATMKSRLQKSYKTGGPRVSVQANADNKILSVEFDEPPEKSP